MSETGNQSDGIDAETGERRGWRTPVLIAVLMVPMLYLVAVLSDLVFGLFYGRTGPSNLLGPGPFERAIGLLCEAGVLEYVVHCAVGGILVGAVGAQMGLSAASATQAGEPIHGRARMRVLVLSGLIGAAILVALGIVVTDWTSWAIG